MKKTYYYSDEITDDFAGTNIKRKELPADYPYFSSNPVRKFFEFILYRLIVTPLIFLFQKIVFREKFKNKKVLKKYRKNGYFIYANHTSAVSDAFTPTLVTFPKKAYILINPDGVSIPVVGKAVEMLGGVPLPTHRRGMKNFHDAVLSHAQKRHCIVIYPEAHIWPYYTKIRPFKDVSFRYPAEADKPVFCFTTTFQKRKFFKHPKETIYVDGPFFPDKNLTPKENQKRLRELVYNAMVERSKASTYEYTEYIKTANLTEVKVQRAPVSAAPVRGASAPATEQAAAAYSSASVFRMASAADESDNQFTETAADSEDLAEAAV